MDFFRAHLLSIITYTPLLGALLLLLPPFKGRDNAVRWTANVFGLLGFLVSLPLWFWFDRGAAGFQFVERHAWIPSIGVQYLFGVDGISVAPDPAHHAAGRHRDPVVLDGHHRPRAGQYYVFLLLLQTGMLGVFCALDMFLFYVFWEVMLVPMYFLIGIWGGARRLYAAIKFFLYTLVGSVVMLLGILALYFHSRKIPGLRADGHLRRHAVVHDGDPGRTCSSGCSWPSSWASPSRSRCSRSTPGCPTPTWRRPPRAP